VSHHCSIAGLSALEHKPLNLQNKIRSMRSSTRPSERACRRRIVAMLLVLALGAVAHGGAAETVGGLTRTLSQATDVRVRVSAALALGRSRDRSAAAPLLTALTDGHPAVRAAAAAGLLALGHKSAVGPLRAQAAREPRGFARSEMLVAASGLEKRGDTHLLVKMDPVRNATNPHADRLLEDLRGSARLLASQLDGIEVVSDAVDAADEGFRRKLPVIAMEGVIQRLSQSRSGNKVAFSARVEFAVRRIPDLAVKAMLGGNAQVSGEAGDAGKIAELESQVLDCAIESALRVAPSTMVSLAQ
jgi:hypothetical protein